MKQNLYTRSLLAALFLLLFGGGIFAEETELITFSKLGYSNAASVGTVKGTGVTITFIKGSNNNEPKYYTSGTAIRAYGGNKFTVKGTYNKITKIEIGFGSSDGSNAITTNVGTYDNGIWTGEAESITFTIGGTSGNRRLASIKVTYLVEATGTEDPQNSFTNATENATVGESYTVQSITTLSSGKQTYTSSDESVATIDARGNVTLKKAGETEITVTTAADNTYKQGSASYILKVAKGMPEVKFVSETFTVYMGTDQNGPALTNPGDGTPTYAISDPEIATIQSSGYILPKKEGTATVTVTTAETDAWLSATAQYTLKVEKTFSVDAEGEYEWVKDASTLKAGDQVLIAYNANLGYVLGTKKDNNFDATDLNSGDLKDEKNTMTVSKKATEATAAILEGSSEGWYFHTNYGYLCATSSSSNYLGAKTKDAAGGDAKAKISISSGNATIEFQGDYTHKQLRYNSQSTLFSCYASGQNLVQIYRKIDTQTPPTVTFSPATGTEVNYGTQVTITAKTATSITYSVNGGEPVTVEGTTASVILNTHSTIKATAVNDYGTSEEVTAEYTIHAESPAFAYDPAAYTITIGDEFTAPTLGKAADYDGTVTYSGDNTDVAEVDAETGGVTVKGAGTATITATGTATERFTATTASYTLTVNKQESSVSFAESVVEITYGDNYNKQTATTEGFSGNLVYTSSDESVVKFHGNNVIDILGPGTVTITATAPATETTSESSASYTLKIYEPADGVEGAAEVLNEDFSKCNGTNSNFGGSNGFTAVPTELGWETSSCQSGPGYLKFGTSSAVGTATSPSFTISGTAPLSFQLAPWVANNSNEESKVLISLTNATFENGETSIEINTKELAQKTFTTFDQYKIIGSGNDAKITFAGNGTSYNRFFLDNVVVGGGSVPAREINLTFGSAGYLTWVATADINISQTEGVKAYQITEATAEGIKMQEVSQVPKGEAVLLEGSGTVQLKRMESAAALPGNKMQACTTTGVTGDGSIYALGNGSKGVGFYRLKGSLQTGKGYLTLSKADSQAKPSYLPFEVVMPTGVRKVDSECAESNAVFTLQGTRVAQPRKGVYIRNGKKFVVK